MLVVAGWHWAATDRGYCMIMIMIIIIIIDINSTNITFIDYTLRAPIQ